MNKRGGGGLPLTKWPDHVVQLKQENTNEETECFKNFSATRRTPSIFIHQQIITSHASSGFLLAEDSLNVQAAACLCTCETVQTGIYVHLCVIACFLPPSSKTTPSCSAIMFRLQVILKVASPWRNSKISGVWLPGSDGSTLAIAQALRSGDPPSNYTIRELPHSVLHRLYDLMGKLQIDVKMFATKTTELSFFVFNRERFLCRLKYFCLQITLWNSSKLSSAGLSWEHDHVLILPDLVTAVRHPVIATCQGSVQVCRYKHAGIWQSAGPCSSPSWCELLLWAEICITSPERGRDKTFETEEVKSRRAITVITAHIHLLQASGSSLPLFLLYKNMPHLPPSQTNHNKNTVWRSCVCTQIRPLFFFWLWQ